MLAYYVDLFVRSLFAVPHLLGSNALGLIWPVILILVGEIIACSLYGWKRVIEKWKQASVIGLAALGVCYTFLFAWCALATNYEVHAALTSKVGGLQSAYDKSDEHEKYAVLRAQSACAELLGENKALGNQNRDQQNTINNCQNQALRLIAPPVRITTVTFFLASNKVDKLNGQNVRFLQILGITNRPVMPVNVIFSCDRDFQIVGQGPYLGGTDIATGEKIAWLNDKSFRFTLESPAWTPERPLGLFIATTSPSITCEVKQN